MLVEASVSSGVVCVQPCVMEVLENEEAAWGHSARGPIYHGHSPLVVLKDASEFSCERVDSRIWGTQVGDPLADTGKYPHN